jgi:hypothetical protein
MNNMGAMRGNKETAKGARMEEKHRRDTEISKYRGQSSSYSFKRPEREVLRRHV